MSLKLLKIKHKHIARIVIVAFGAVCLWSGWVFIKWNFATAIATHLEARLPETKIIAAWLTELSPSDADAHYALAVGLEKSFEPGDVERALVEYERAAQLSPDDYRLWLALARASSRSGDGDGAQTAFQRAHELAPNYAHLQWAFGNFLVRQNRIDDGFAFIAKAAASNPQYSGPAAVFALQIFDGDANRVREMLGGGEASDVALAPVFASLKRYDDSLAAWNRLPSDLKITKHKKLGEQLIEQMVGANQFRYATHITADLIEGDVEKPLRQKIVNGGFERGVKLKDAGRFEWQIGEGNEPQVGLSETQKHSGRYGLWMVFNTFETAHFRQVSQVVAVEPKARYRLEAYYIYALKTASRLKVEIINPATGLPLGMTGEMSPTNEWKPLSVEFVMPNDVDGVRIQLRREGCNGPACPVTGTLGLDEFSLTRL